MAELRVSSVGSERRTVEFEEGQTLAQISDTLAQSGEGLPLSTENGNEVWMNGEKVDTPGSHTPADGDALVYVPNFKGA